MFFYHILVKYKLNQFSPFKLKKQGSLPLSGINLVNSYTSFVTGLNYGY